LGTWGWLDGSHVRNEMEVVAGDICDRDSVVQAMRGVEIVLHLAALIGIPYSYHAPASYVRTNVEGTLNVLQVARETGVERLVHTSTSEVYGTARYVPIDEEHPLQGQSPYSATKIAADKLTEAFHLSFGLPITIIRPFNTYGPRMHPHDGRVVSNFIIQALKNEPITICGSGEQTRSFCYVDDMIEAIIRFMGSRDDFTGPVNLGNSVETSILELAHKVIGLTGSRSKPEYGPLPSDDPVQRCPDITLARTELDWQPTVSLEEGLRKTIEYFEQLLRKGKACGKWRSDELEEALF